MADVVGEHVVGNVRRLQEPEQARKFGSSENDAGLMSERPVFKKQSCPTESASKQAASNIFAAFPERSVKQDQPRHAVLVFNCPGEGKHTAEGMSYQDDLSGGEVLIDLHADMVQLL